jgi:hypothetical protein
MDIMLQRFIACIRCRSARRVNTSQAPGPRYGSALVSLVVATCMAWIAPSTPAQTPVILPNTITTIAGSFPMATTGSGACPSNAQFAQQDTAGDGCPAINATFSGAEKAITVDPEGNVYISSDTSNPQFVRRIDARTGNITVFAGFGANSDLSSTAVTYYGTLYTPIDKEGDGLPVVYSGGFFSNRGLGSDPYGNIFIGTVGSNVVHLVCTAVSPLCSAAAVRVNLMTAIAGCTYSSASYGVAVTGTTPGTAGDGGPATQVAANSSSCTIGTHAPGTITADKWDNVYFMDRLNGRIRVVAGAASITVNSISVTNPLIATLAAGGYSTFAQGNIYPIAGGGTVCSGKTDSGGDGCLFTQTIINTGNSGATVQGFAVDPDGDFIFDDGNGYLRVIYEGGTTIKGALSALGISSPVVGTSYRLIGGGTTYFYSSGIPAPILGSSFQLQSQYQTLAVDPGGNIYISDQLQILFYDIATGYVRRIGTSSGATSCNSTAYGDGCPLSQALYGVASNPLPIAMDSLGNLYMIDAASTSGHKLIRMVSATILPTTAVNGSQSSSLIVHAPATGSTVAITAGAGPDFTVGSPACITNTATDKSVDCTAVVTYAPKSLAQRSIPISIATTVSSTTTTQNESLTATSTGSALVFDTLGAPSLATLGASATGNTAVALDRYGNVYVSGTQGISKVNGSTVTNISATPAGYLAVDTSGNVYATSSGSTTVTKYAYSAASSSYTSATISIPTIPINGTGTQAYGGPIAVDSDGVVYLTDLTNKQVVKFTQGSLVGQQLTQTALTSPASMTQDSYGNLLVIDGTSVVKIPSAGVPLSTANTTPVANPTVSFPTALVSPNSIAVDQAENIYVTDSGNLIARTLGGYQYTVPLSGPALPTAPLPSSSTVASTTTLTLTNATDTLSGTLSIAVGSGAAHTITVASGSTLSSLSTAINADNTYSAESVTASLTSNVLTISGPVAVSSNLVLTGTTLMEKTPVAGLATAVAVDGAGDLYLTASSVSGVSKVLRNAESNTFGTDVSDPYIGVFANAGATAATGFTQTDAGGNYTVSTPTTALATGAPTCVLTSTALAGGGLCNASVTFSPTSTGTGDTPNVISLLPSTNTLGALTLDGTKNGSTATTTTTITGNTAGLVYSTGTETTFTVTVTQSTGSPSGQVTVYIDSNPGANYTLGAANGTSASVNVPISSATATSHTIYAVYAGSAGIAGSTSSTTNFSIAQATTSVSWTPARTAIQYSSPIGLTVLNATAASGGNSVPGTFVYTANSAEVNAASYLAINTYSLGVTFYPTDSVDYSSSTGSVSNFVVQQATTTAPIGGSQVVVGTTGNYSSVQAAINALPVTGGSVYIQPGTYTGDVSVTQPNVALRGLGGDPTKVIITHPGGAFSSSSGSVYSYAGEFNTSITNGYQLPAGSTLFNSVAGDAGSATLVVARGINTAVSSSATTPNGFYGENLTLNNTWDTDSTQTTTYVSGGVCTAGAGQAMSYSALYNAGIECASQALAIWITSDNAVLNNVYTSSLQDTVYAGAISTGSAYPARQFWFRGKITGDVDYIFGDAAAVFDHTSIYSAYHSTAGGTVTIEAQNKAAQTGSSGDYLSGYVMNSDVFTSQNSGMSSLYFGRPYGTYSTWIMLNSYIDQVNALGYIPFSGANALTYATYGEYTDHAYTDPSNGSPDLNGVTFLGTSAASSGSGVLPTSARESASLDPGYTPFSANTTNSVGMTQAQAQAWYPLAFLGKTITTNQFNTVATWDPTAAIAADVNAFVPSNSPSSITAGQSITLLMRPQTPGVGAVSNGVYAIPTGTYIATENGNTIASGTLDASGAAYFTTSTLTPGVHNFKWTYSGDSNFAGSTTATAYSLTVTGSAAATTTVLTPTPNPATYGQSVSLIATVLSGGSPVNSGTVTFTADGATVASYVALNGSGQASTSVNGLTVGTHNVAATYNGAASYSTSFSSGTTATVNQATLTITGSCSNRVFGAANVCSAGVSGYKNGDNAATVFTSAPTGTTTAIRTSPANTYTASVGTYTLSTLGSTNYTVSAQTSTFTISGGAPQSILFAQLPNFASGGSYQLTASTTSGLPVSYTVTVGNAIASVSGSTLTLSGPGTVTVQASQSTDPTGDYAAATPVSRSFTAQ